MVAKLRSFLICEVLKFLNASYIYTPLTILSYIKPSLECLNVYRMTISKTLIKIETK